MKAKYILRVLCLAAGIAALSSCAKELDYPEKTSSLITSITTGSASPTATSATLAGNVAGLSGVSSSSYTVGFCYGTGEDPASTGTKQPGSYDTDSGDVSASVAGLKEGTTYYYVVYACLQGQLTVYGDVKSFVATDAAIVTAPATEVGATTVILNGQVSGIADDMDKVSVGFVLAAEQEDVYTSALRSDVDINSEGTFSADGSGFFPATTFYYAAYVTIDGATQYGEIEEVTTDAQELEFVDLGLDALWATCNLGSETQSYAGALAGYGDLTGINVSESLSQYADFDISETESDPVTAIFGSSSAEMNCMPTEADFKQLYAATTQTWETVDGVDGVRFTASNGNSIFLPAAPARTGLAFSDVPYDLVYQTGQLSASDDSYYRAFKIPAQSDVAEYTMAKRCVGLPIRPVKRALEHEGLPVKNANLVQGDLEDNGKYRLEIYNEYGTTAEAPVVDPELVVFQENIQVTFTITGVPEGRSFEAYYAFASSDWGLQHWSYQDAADEFGTASCLIDGDGTYTLTLHGAAGGVTVFCIDINDLGGDNADGVYAKIDKVELDVKEDIEGIKIKNAKIVQGDIESNGNYRIEIYNEYGNTKNDPPVNTADIAYTNDMRVVFTLTGVPAGKDYQAYLAYADSDWSPSNWGYNADGNASCIVNGDGTYTIDFIAGEGDGAMVFCIDIAGLAADVPEGVHATVDEISFDHYLLNPTIRIDNSKVLQGDIESNGNWRVEIYNEYGSGTKDNSPINTADIDFQRTMRVIFTVDGTVPEGEYETYLAFADANWGASNWAYNKNGNGSVMVNGAGQYVIDLTTGPGSGVIVFCLDFKGLGAAGYTGNVTIDKIIMDPDAEPVEQRPEGELLINSADGAGVDLRLEIYNDYGSSKNNSIIDPATIVFHKSMAVTFTISGINDNLKTGDNVPTTFYAGLEYSDPTWGVGYWSGKTAGKYEAAVTGDGTYTVWMETTKKANGAVVFCVDIGKLWENLVDPSLVKASIDQIVFDGTFNFPINAEPVSFQNKDGNGTDGRIEIYNEYGNGGTVCPGWYNDRLFFHACPMIVRFKIEGIDGNLIDGATADFKADLSYAAASWAPSSWGTDYGCTQVTGDGTYEVFACIPGEAAGAVVWTIEIYDLWKSLVDTDLIAVSIEDVIIPGIHE